MPFIAAAVLLATTIYFAALVRGVRREKQRLAAETPEQRQLRDARQRMLEEQDLSARRDRESRRRRTASQFVVATALLVVAAAFLCGLYLFIRFIHWSWYHSAGP